MVEELRERKGLILEQAFNSFPEAIEKLPETIQKAITELGKQQRDSLQLDSNQPLIHTLRNSTNFFALMAIKGAKIAK